MSCYATPSCIDLYMYYIRPSVDVDLAITIDHIVRLREKGYIVYGMQCDDHERERVWLR